MVTGRDLETGASWKDRIERFRLVCVYIYIYIRISEITVPSNLFCFFRSISFADTLIRTRCHARLFSLFILAGFRTNLEENFASIQNKRDVFEVNDV